MSRIFILILTTLLAGESWALRSNYVVRSGPGGARIGLTTQLGATLTGRMYRNWAQVRYVRNGRTRTAWVHRSAVTENDLQFSQSRSLREGFNLRTRPGVRGSRVIGLSHRTPHFLTGARRGRWHQIAYMKNGRLQKAWVHRSGVSSQPRRVHQPAIEQIVKKTPVKVDQVKTQKVADERPKTAWPVVQDPQDSKKNPTVKAEKAKTPQKVVQKAVPIPEAKKDLPKRHKPAKVAQKKGRQKDKKIDEKDQMVHAPASSVVKRFPANSELCDFGGDAVMEKNCQAVLAKVEQGALPRQATLYSLQTFKSTFGKYCDGDKLKNKVRNSCSFFFADLDGKYKGKAYQSPAYLIDLCAGDSSRTHLKDLVNATYTNRGKRSGKNRKKAKYSDIGGRGTTLAGVFRTGELTGFHPAFGSKNRARYRRLLGYNAKDKKCKGKGNYRNSYLAGCSVLRLGLDRIGGARTDASKPMHTSPYSSSAGCPSVGKHNNWIMRYLASKGTSLYIAHTKRKGFSSIFDKPKRSCKQDPDEHNSYMRSLAGGFDGAQ